MIEILSFHKYKYHTLEIHDTVLLMWFITDIQWDNNEIYFTIKHYLVI